MIYCTVLSRGGCSPEGGSGRSMAPRAQPGWKPAVRPPVPSGGCVRPWIPFTRPNFRLWNVIVWTFKWIALRTFREELSERVKLIPAAFRRLLPKVTHSWIHQGSIAWTTQIFPSLKRRSLRSCMHFRKTAEEKKEGRRSPNKTTGNKVQPRKRQRWPTLSDVL